MFTVEQINAIHTRLGSAEPLSDYVHALHAIGVERYASFLTDGHADYFGQHGWTVSSSPSHDQLSIAGHGDKEGLLKHLNFHEQGKTTYLEMSRGLAESGIEQWTVDTRLMTMTFFDRAGNAVLVDVIS